MSSDRSGFLEEKWMEFVSKQLERLEKISDENRKDSNDFQSKVNANIADFQSRVGSDISELKLVTKELIRKCKETESLPAIIPSSTEMQEVKNAISELGTQIVKMKNGGDTDNNKGDRISRWQKIPDWLKLLLFFVAGGAIGMGPEAFKALLEFFSKLLGG